MFMKIVNAPMALLLCMLIILIENTGCRTAIFEIKNVTCRKYNKEPVKQISCEFVKRGTNNYSITLQTTFSRNLVRSFKSHVTIDVMPSNSRQIIHLIDLRFNSCMFLQQSLTNQLIKPLIAEFKRVTNLPKKCPYKKDVLYEAKNFSLTKSFIPSYFPSVSYNTTLHHYDRNEIIGTIQIFGGSEQKSKR
ncbi:uncharacterized protein LOC101887221 [Musca domestica]|uniref:Uncharacterized protein LOC101887221 n=1 Tax=Musca domestica TaxID=7370 RepID=A0A1I8N5X3_MUSDO|nr:uncharacterized protein LOC101887221 [Musca domestica]